MSPVLLVDYGASRVKGVVWCRDSGRVLRVTERSAPRPSAAVAGHVEIEPGKYVAILEDIGAELLALRDDIAELWLCTEMHGFLLADARGNPRTQYLSWRDDRSAGTVADLKSRFGARFRDVTGMVLRPGLPIATLAHVAAGRSMPISGKLCTLSDWIMMASGCPAPKGHVSLAAGTGLYDLRANCWSGELLELIGVASDALEFGECVDAGQPLGRISVAGRALTAFGGLGDLQAAAHGAGVGNSSILGVNLGTGSQVVRNTEKFFENPAEVRPGANGGFLAALTHIPSGRSLDVFAAFFDDIAHHAGGRLGLFWEIFSDLSPEEILESPLAVDLNLFSAAWRYSEGGGAIQGILEGNFCARKMVAGTIKSWLAQYVLACDVLDADRRVSDVVVFGGLARRAACAAPVLSTLLKRDVRLADPKTGEETLDGLAKLAARGPSSQGARSANR